MPLIGTVRGQRLGLFGDVEGSVGARAFGLPSNWRESVALTQVFGDRWLDAGSDLALWVPS